MLALSLGPFFVGTRNWIDVEGWNVSSTKHRSTASEPVEAMTVGIPNRRHADALPNRKAYTVYVLLDTGKPLNVNKSSTHVMDDAGKIKRVSR